MPVLVRLSNIRDCQILLSLKSPSSFNNRPHNPKSHNHDPLSHPINVPPKKENEIHCCYFLIIGAKISKEHFTPLLFVFAEITTINVKISKIIVHILHHLLLFVPAEIITINVKITPTYKN